MACSKNYLSAIPFVQALSKVPTNVQHFAELGVYKQMRKKEEKDMKEMFPHLPRNLATFKLVSDIAHLFIVFEFGL